jgi:TRAP-type C4-dicarboxylate transport system permease small subunit
MTGRLLQGLRLIERGVVVALFAAMLGLFFANIAVRVVIPTYASSIAWAEEAARIAMIWAVFLIAGITLERGRHIAMTTLTMQFPIATQRALRRLTGVVGALLFGYFWYLCTTMMMLVIRSGQVLPDLQISSGFLYLGPAIGFALLAVRYLAEIFVPRLPVAHGADQAGAGAGA